MKKVFQQTKLEIAIPERSRRIYILGADTYVGAHFVHEWGKRGFHVCGCGKSQHLPESLSDCEYAQTDYRTFPLSNDKFDWLMICNDPRDGYDVYTNAVRNCCEYFAAKKNSIKMVYLSSVAVCSSRKNGIPENVPLEPRSAYEMNFATVENWLNVYSSRLDGKISAYIFRTGDIYGDDLCFPEKPGLLNFYWESAENGNPILMPGLGLKYRTVSHIRDICRSAADAMSLDFLPRKLNLPGEKMTVVDYAVAMAEAYGVGISMSDSEIVKMYANPFAGNLNLLSTEFRKLLVFKPDFCFRDWLHGITSRKSAGGRHEDILLAN